MKKKDLVFDLKKNKGINLFRPNKTERRLFICGCATPKTYFRTMEPKWTTIEIGGEIKYEDAWEEVLDILVRKFDIAVSQKDNGYIRTDCFKQLKQILWVQ